MQQQLTTYRDNLILILLRSGNLSLEPQRKYQHKDSKTLQITRGKVGTDHFNFVI